MDFWDLTKLIFRRWYVSVPLILVAIGATLYAKANIRPDYVATSYVQLIPPAVTPKPNEEKKAVARNPWLDLGLGSLTKAGMISVQDRQVVKQLKKTGFSDDFTLTQDQQLPIVTFEVVGTDEAQATRTTEELVKRFSASVQTLQKEYGAPKDQMITDRRLDQGDNVEESTSKLKRALIAIAALGLLLAVALTIAADALLRRRKRPGAPEPAAVEPTAPKPGGAPAVRQPATPVILGSRTGARTSGEYRSPSSEPAEQDAETTTFTVPGEETTVLGRPGEETIVLPPNWQIGNGRKNGSKRP